MKTIAFFNNKGGVGKTTLVYHLAWMMADLGARVLAVDLDPQANLTSMFLGDRDLEEIWPDGDHPDTIFGALRPIISGTGDVKKPKGHEIVDQGHEIADRLTLIAGDLGLSSFEDKLSDAWPRCQNGDEAAFRATTAFYRGFMQVARDCKAEFVLVDVGPNLGAINRAALISCDYVVVPLGPDLFSVQGLRNLGPTLKRWRADWKQIIGKNPNAELELPKGNITPLGYVVLQHGMRDNQPPKAYQKWIDRFPREYRKAVLDDTSPVGPDGAPDPNLLAMLKNYRSLMPMAMQARKPMFFLRSADGAIGAHLQATKQAYEDFEKLARAISARAGAPLD